VINLYGRFRTSGELDPSQLIKRSERKLPSLDYGHKEGASSVTEQITDSPADSNAVEKNKVKINSATPAELISLAGIGPTLAERIIEYREAIGKFRNAKDLVKVKGIGPKNVQRILSQIEFD